jgi:tRNA A37 threonylcarbamoyladenosine biosynthesis protein TsaE
MIQEELTRRIRASFGFVPTADQERAITLFADFVTDTDPQVAMVLRGSAGTGKTSLASAIVRALTALQQKMVLLAPTGRAAKVFSLYAGHPAYTIHRRIYRQKTAGDLSAFNLNENLHTNTLFLVDEASMVSHGVGTVQLHGAADFGSGDLLDDLIHYIYNGAGCRLLLIGDAAQLPPVGEEEAPALSGGLLRDYGLRVYETDLSEVLRQSQTSGVLWNATVVRRMVEQVRHGGWQGADGDAGVSVLLPRLQLKGFTDITVVPGDELIESLAGSYSRVGIDETIVVTRSNKRANIYNRGIRNTVLDREEELTRGDQLMVVKNNYSLIPKPSSKEKGSDPLTYPPPTGGIMGADGLTYPPPTGGGRGGLDDRETPTFLANGDRCVVQRVRGEEALYGFRFAEATLVFPDYDDYELTCKVLLDTLTAEAPALTHEQQEQLFAGVMADYADLALRADRVKALKSDPYYNALQIKYGYAVTCHKAQGGQWAHVYIDQGYMTDDMLTPDYLHWLYTALTRATEKVFLVNWPKKQVEGEE